jgi:Uma2 family endonuclease
VHIFKIEKKIGKLKMSVVAKKKITPEEYLEIERKAEYKSEYFNGEMFAMAGASRRHNLITGNVFAQLHSQLRKRSCEIYQSDMRVKVSQTGLYSYPDVTVVCGTAMFEDKNIDTLLNPTLIVEVLSESTETYDRGRKFEHYRQIESLMEYLLIAQDKYRIEQFIKQENGLWLLSETKGLEGVFKLPSINCELLISEIYDKVEFK